MDTYAERIVEAARAYYKALALHGDTLDKEVCEARRHLFACLVARDGIDKRTSVALQAREYK